MTPHEIIITYYLPIRIKIVAKSELPNSLNLLSWSVDDELEVDDELKVDDELEIDDELEEDNESVVRKRVKNAWANPRKTKSKTTKNGKTFLGTPIIMAK